VGIRFLSPWWLDITRGEDEFLHPLPLPFNEEEEEENDDEEENYPPRRRKKTGGVIRLPFPS